MTEWFGFLVYPAWIEVTEPTVRLLESEVLKDLGYHVFEVEDGARALKILNSTARIDLLATDVGLSGGMNGRQVADAARAVRPDLTVLFITGYAESAVITGGDATKQLRR